MRRWVEEDEVVREVEKATGDSESPIAASLRRWLAKQPEVPPFVGSSAAAKLLAIPTPHVSRLRDQGRMPAPISVEGSVDIYIRDEVIALAKELKKERAARAKRREAKNG